MIEYKLYYFSHPTTNEIRYIGFTSKKLEYRLYEHLRKAHDKKSYNCHRNKWLRKLISEGLKPNILLIESHFDKDFALKREIELIKEYREKGYRLVNNTDGGEAFFGYKETPEVKEKRRLKSLGRKNGPCSEERKRKISESNKGRKWTEEQKQKMRKPKTEEHRKKCAIANLGKKMSLEAREKMSMARKKEWANGERKCGAIGKKWSEERKASIRGENNSFYGKKHSPEKWAEIKLKMKEAWARKRILKKQTLIND